MTRKKTLLKALVVVVVVVVVVAGLFFLSAPNVWAQTCCEADINHDGKVTGGDLGVLKREYGTFGCVNCYAPVPKTGQTTSYATGDDGDLEKGVVWPTPRFTDNGDGTVTDNLTGLMWTKNAQQIPGLKQWSQAIADCNALNFATYTDWRLPNVKELSSLIDFDSADPALPYPNPFTNVDEQLHEMWTSTTYCTWSEWHWYINMYRGAVDRTDYWNEFQVWCVRGGR